MDAVAFSASTMIGVLMAMFHYPNNFLENGTGVGWAWLEIGADFIQPALLTIGMCYLPWNLSWWGQHCARYLRALDHLFNHPNTPIHIASRLVQRFGMSLRQPAMCPPSLESSSLVTLQQPRQRFCWQTMS